MSQSRTIDSLANENETGNLNKVELIMGAVIRFRTATCGGPDDVDSLNNNNNNRSYCSARTVSSQCNDRKNT